MRSLDDFVRAGKVLYLGVSSWPAWVVVKANSYARALGYSPFVVYQGGWKTADRDIEREVVPMCKAEGMAITVWGAMASGKFKNAEQRNEGGGRADVDDRSGSNSKSEIFERVFEYWGKVGQRGKGLLV
jgi:aryl-alcohol dehydrogenase-like predicted oxidoreductase